MTRCTDCGANPLLYPCQQHGCPYLEPDYAEDYDSPLLDSDEDPARDYEPIGPHDREYHCCDEGYLLALASVEQAMAGKK